MKIAYLTADPTNEDAVDALVAFIEDGQGRFEASTLPELLEEMGQDYDEYDRDGEVEVTLVGGEFDGHVLQQMGRRL